MSLEQIKFYLIFLEQKFFWEPSFGFSPYNSLNGVFLTPEKNQMSLVSLDKFIE